MLISTLHCDCTKENGMSRKKDRSCWIAVFYCPILFISHWTLTIETQNLAAPKTVDKKSPEAKSINDSDRALHMQKPR